ncbi:MAG TPA: Na(+)-translocating NADH-quinone reductase subunit A [Cyclobacteriaceae bacterium]|nr:Na(+)-translocating NADH-quinone reductase subunit A [Cyclobacteriaceae bacterium]
MGKHIRLRKGFDINLAGKASPTISTPDQPDVFAIKPTDFEGVYLPRVLVNVGDTVKAGTPLFRDKRFEQVMFTAPVSGEVIEIKRGEKRKLLEVKVLADKSFEHVEFRKYSAGDLTSLSREQAQEQLLSSGVWANLVQRPFGVIADPGETPKAIFISGFDSHPLAPDYNLIFKGEEQYFQAGIDVLKKFTSGPIHVNLRGDNQPSIFSGAKGVEFNYFTGPHPAGCVGVQIHHLDPINRGEIAWTISPSGVIQIGKLFLNGIYDASRIVALAGSEVKKPQYYKTWTGASINKMIENNITSDRVRYISGNVLTGTRIPADGFIGFFDHLVTVIPEGDYYEFLGWISHGFKKLSLQRAWGLLSFLAPQKEYVLDTNTRGEPRAFVQTGVFEKVTPMDILPTYLIKAIIAEDFDEMEALGIYEVIEEDLALCDFVDVSKHNIQAILREGIELIRNS